MLLNEQGYIFGYRNYHTCGVQIEHVYFGLYRLTVLPPKSNQVKNGLIKIQSRAPVKKETFIAFPFLYVTTILCVSKKV
jgi:hypothetical protein